MTDQEINEAVARKLGYMSDKTDPRSVTDYCRSIAAAWEVVESLKNHSVTIRKADALTGWYCNIFSWQGYPNGEKQPEIEAEADTAPMAICLAFLISP